MKHVITVLIVGLLIVLGLACERAGREKRPSVGAEAADAPHDGIDDPPLLLDNGPLLLDEEHEYLLLGQPTEDVPGGADNRRCYVCHINYLQDEIAVKHARVGIGCADCHGASDEHIDDESWAWGGTGTAPDVMFLRDQINASCFKCHPAGKLSRDFHDVPALAGSSEKVCTDCHGDHRLHTRRTEWK